MDKIKHGSGIDRGNAMRRTRIKDPAEVGMKFPNYSKAPNRKGKTSEGRGHGK
jgi:hypothetical protein